MTFFPKLSTSRLWSFSILLPSAFFLAIFAQSLGLGITDDEAYYWVLAQRPSWGYAYHPPMVAWWIALTQNLLGPIFGANSLVVVRLPSALGAALVLGIAGRWLEEANLTGVALKRALGVVLGFSGLFALAWLMVPDVPLLLGWMILFRGVWKISFRDEWAPVSLFAGTVLLLLSKYSGVLAIGSAFLCLLVYGGRWRARGIVVLLVASVVAAIPILYWNATHEWVSILYQVQGRHQGASLSWTRYGRFLLIEGLLVGPALLYFLATIRKKRARFFLFWILPAFFVFFTQPLFSDFKPHWALVAWFPCVLWMAWSSPSLSRTLVRIHFIYGVLLALLAFSVIHFPVISLFSGNPLMDVSNDLVGWDELLIPEAPVLGSRYQTASHAMFALNRPERVSLWPRDAGSVGEWPELNPDDLDAFYFVRDQRYSETFLRADFSCSLWRTITPVRFGRPGKWIAIDYCVRT